MPVNKTNPQYEAASPLWAKMRDVVAGEEAVHEKGETYLPRLSGQDTNEYGAYVMRAGFYNATQRTLDGLSGMVFRKPPQVTLPTAMEEFQEDVTLDGQSLTAFAEALVEEELVVSRAGVLVDYPRNDGQVTTRAQADALNQRPMLRLYTAENIIDWRVGQRDNVTTLMQVRLHECIEVEAADEFTSGEVEQIRVLELVEGRYQQRLFQKLVQDTWEEVTEEPIVPLMNGAPLDYIPFIFVSPRGTQPAIVKPVLLDLANANLSHYRTVADLEHGAHYTALPTPYVFGVDDDHAPDAIGPTELWHGPSGEVVVGLLEFTGQGLDALEKRAEKKEQQMAALGARMLAPEKRQAEAADAIAIRHSGEMSVLASLANAVSDALTQALAIARDWMGLSDEVKVELNTDFLPMPMSPQMLQQLVAAWQSGALAFEDLVYQLHAGEVVREERTAEDIQADVETSPAGGMAQLRGIAGTLE